MFGRLLEWPIFYMIERYESLVGGLARLDPIRQSVWGPRGPVKHGLVEVGDKAQYYSQWRSGIRNLSFSMFFFKLLLSSRYFSDFVLFCIPRCDVNTKLVQL